MSHDYGLCSDDRRAFNMDFSFVTLEEDGGLPGFTCPSNVLKEITEEGLL
jgi:hypothetical protein